MYSENSYIVIEDGEGGYLFPEGHEAWRVFQCLFGLEHELCEKVRLRLLTRLGVLKSPRQSPWTFIKVENDRGWTRPEVHILIDLVREVRIMPAGRALQLLEVLFDDELAGVLLVRFLTADLYVSLNRRSETQVTAHNRRERWWIEANQPLEKAA